MDAQPLGVVVEVALHGGGSMRTSIGGTLRSLTLDGLQRLRDRVATVVDSVTSAHQCNASISWSADACKITSCTILCSLMPPTTKLIFFSTHLTFCYLFSVCFTFRPTDG